MVDSGSWYRTGFRWPHDGKPLESDHFIVYSDAASLESRQKLAEIGEELLVVLTEEFEIDPATQFLFPDGQSKIHIFTYKNQTPMKWGGWGYYGGLLIFSLDHELRTEWGHTELENYRAVVKHELMHTIEGLLKGSDNPQLVDVWLTEGIAEYVSGGTTGEPITTLAKFEEVIGRFGELNPIAMHQYGYTIGTDVAGFYYYPMFLLTMAYLLDPTGGGLTNSAIRDIYLDARAGIPFSVSFEEKMGISLQDFEDQFFERLRAYLD